MFCWYFGKIGRYHSNKQRRNKKDRKDTSSVLQTQLQRMGKAWSKPAQNITKTDRKLVVPDHTAHPLGIWRPKLENESAWMCQQIIQFHLEIKDNVSLRKKTVLGVTTRVKSFEFNKKQNLFFASKQFFQRMESRHSLWHWCQERSQSFQVSWVTPVQLGLWRELFQMDWNTDQKNAHFHWK